ncbi:MAG: hemin-degrading factor [Saccharospirillum sp.]
MNHNELASAWQQLKQNQPRLRIRDAARELNVSELELLLTRLGEGVTWLDLEGRLLADELSSLGPVMSLVRNDCAVHETTGRFGVLGGGAQVGLFLGEQDSRLFFKHWVFILAVIEGERESIQVFDATGQAVIKIYRLAHTDSQAWEALIQTRRTVRTHPLALLPQTVLERRPVKDPQALIEGWSQITDVHQFNSLLKSQETDRLSAFEVAGSNWAQPVPCHAMETVMNACKECRIPLMTFVSNTGVVQIHTGSPGQLKRTGPWYNILDPNFNLHLNTQTLTSAWVVRRPTIDGCVTSVEAFDALGRTVIQFFGQRIEGEQERDDWRALADSLAEVAEEGIA